MKNGNIYGTYINHMVGNNRSALEPDMLVEIVQKQNQRTGELTEGIIKRILTKSKSHPNGTKVQLKTGEVGRVKNIIKED